MVSSYLVISPCICWSDVNAFEFCIVFIYPESNANKTSCKGACIRQ